MTPFAGRRRRTIRGVIAAWAPLPITDDAVARVRDNAESEIRLAATLDGRMVGIGVLAPQVHEMRACYVSPAHGRRGVGRALVLAIEEMALARGLTRLVLDASVTAELFYRRLGYEVVSHGEHVLRGGVRMACAMMRKGLCQPEPFSDKPVRAPFPP